MHHCSGLSSLECDGNPTKAHVAQRQAEELSKRENIRCLKRYLASEIFQGIRKSHLFDKQLTTRHLHTLTNIGASIRRGR